MIPAMRPRSAPVFEVWKATALLALLPAACSGGAESVGPVQDLNVILISMDTTRADRVSAYGEHPRETTPAIDEMAAESVIFGDVWAQATATGPSHRSMLTGMYVHRHGMLANRQMISSPFTLATELKEHGWATGAFTGGGTTREQFGLTGFDVYESSGGPHKPRARSFSRTWPMAEKWLESLRQPDGGYQRFFLFLHGYDPHCPYWPPAEVRDYAAWYQGSFDPREKCGFDDFSPLIQRGELGEEEFRYISDLYDGGVTWGDRQLAGLFAWLKERGQLDKTVIVFTSDHGESLGEHQYVGHSRMWNEQIRVPLLIRFPRGQWAGRIDDPVESVDIVPTLLDYLGVPIPEGVNGQSLMPRIRGDGPAPQRDMRLCKYGNYEAVLFDERWKISFVRRSSGPEEPALFDLLNDPGELNNLVESAPDGRQRFDELFERYRAWRQAQAAEDKRWRGIKLGAADEATQAELDQLGYAEEAEMDLEEG